MKILLTLFAIACMASGLAQAQAKAVVPFTINKNIIYIYCRVNDVDSLKFLFDTGANVSVINTSSKKTPHLLTSSTSVNTGSNGTGSVDVSDGNKFKLGSIEKNDSSFTLIDFGTDDFDGILGTDLMKGSILQINYNNNEITFYNEDDNNINYDDYVKMKLHMVDNYPAVESVLIANGKKYKGLFGLDSGADDLLTIAAPFAKKHGLESRMKNIGSSTFQGSEGPAYEMPIVQCPTINFSGKLLYNIPVALSAATQGVDSTTRMAGFFGNNFLKRFNTILDFNKGLVFFKVNKNLYFDVYQ